MERAKTLLAGGMSISQAALDTGFADQSHFSRCFREFTGATPGQYLGGHACPAKPTKTPGDGQASTPTDRQTK